MVPKLEKILASVGKMRILNVLVAVNELNITSIARKARVGHSRTIKHLKELQELDIVMQKNFGRIKIFRINDTIEDGRKIIEFLRYWQNKEIVCLDSNT